MTRTKQKKAIYLDYASTTPVDKRVFRAMIPYFTEKFGNPMSLHSLGQEAKVALEKSRKKIAGFLGVKSSEIIFTGSATESNNLALKGVVLRSDLRTNFRTLESKHIIISSVEHESLMESAKWLEKQGFVVTRLKVDKYGIVNVQELEKAITKNTILVSIIHANNEIGTIQPLVQIGQLLKTKNSKLKTKIYFHTDAAQSFGRVPIDIQKAGVDLLTASSHKIYGPKGAALLYVREGTKIESLLHGGGQEEGMRSSTVNLPAIVGFAEALQICKQEMKKEIGWQRELRNGFIKGVLEKVPGSRLNGHPKNVLPNIVNFTFKGVEGEALVLKLDLLGIYISTGSACSVTSLEPSHVLLALGLNPKDVQSSVRFSLGRFTTEKEIDYVLKILPKAIKELREKLLLF